MMKRQTIGLILLLTLLLAILLPIIFRDKTESPNNVINIIGTLVSSISSLLTLLIAVILFNKYGIEAPLLQKKSEVVFAFLEEFKKVGFFIRGGNFGLLVRPYDQHNEFFEEWYSEKLIFSTEYLDGLDEVMKVSDSPFMPKSIYEKVNKLRFYTLVEVGENDLVKYAKVQVLGKPVKDSKYGLLNNAELTLFEFLNIIDDIKSAIKVWISENSNIPPDLNI